jgi:hypothetical protein
MLEEQNWYYAMKYALDYNLGTSLAPVEIIDKMVDNDAFSIALKYIVALGPYDARIQEKYLRAPTVSMFREERREHLFKWKRKLAELQARRAAPVDPVAAADHCWPAQHDEGGIRSV